MTELVFSECIKGQKWGLRMGQNSPLGAKTQRLREWWLGVEPEHSRRTACVKSEAVQAWSAFQASIRACETTSPRTWPPVVPQKGWVSLLYTGSSVPIRHPWVRQAQNGRVLVYAWHLRGYLSKILRRNQTGGSRQKEIQPHQETTKEAYQNCLALTCDSTPNVLSGPGESTYSHLLKHQSEATPCIHYP